MPTNALHLNIVRAIRAPGSFPPALRRAVATGLVVALWFTGRPASAAEAPPGSRWTVGRAILQPDAWFQSEEGVRVLGIVLTNQSPAGSWPKNVNTAAGPLASSPEDLHGTFDNGATTGELRLLAKAFNAAPEPRYRDAFVKGLDAVLAGQYPTGGWPQYFPPPTNSYHRYITYNDYAMQRLLELLREVAEDPQYRFVPPAAREKAATAFQRGIDCIVKSQIKVDGRLTVWCAQHDPVTLEPRPARAFELVSLSGAESAGLLLFLMKLQRPSPETVRAVHAGAEWFERSKITGIRQTRVNGDKKIVQDPDAEPLWARFYEIATNRPFFCGRDGVMKFDIAEIEAERRNGYAWYGSWGDNVARRYASWRKQFPEEIQESK
jgi:PelA/Pel-15E family pectate lyase